MGQRSFVGFNSVDNLLSVLSRVKARSIFLVTGKLSFQSSGADRILNRYLHGATVCRYYDFDTNPKMEDIDKGVKAFVDAEPDVVIAVGGGSVLDTAKMINFFACNGIAPECWFGGGHRAGRPTKPLIAIPTTSGSGSEATPFAVVYVGKTKYSVEHDTILPDFVIIDPVFTHTLPEYTTAASGMDALSQAVESYWNIHSSETSRELALEAIRLIYPNILRATKTPTPEIRLAMAEGAFLAGKAIRLTKTTAAHALSYPLTSYFGIAHGHAVGVVLPAIYEFNYQVTEHDLLDRRGCPYVRSVLETLASELGAQDAAGVFDAWRHLLEELGLESRLSRLGVKTKEDMDIIIANGFSPDRVRNNPRMLNKTVVEDILQAIL